MCTGLDALQEFAYRSNLLGSGRTLASVGGGNTSTEGTVPDHVGRQTCAPWVRGSGTDLATITPTGFTVLRLDELTAPLGITHCDRRSRLVREEFGTEGSLARLLPAVIFTTRVSALRFAVAGRAPDTGNL